MCDYVIYAMFVAIGATVWLLWELTELVYRKVQCKRMKCELLKAYHNNRLHLTNAMDRHKLLSAAYSKDYNLMFNLYNEYFYKGELRYEWYED